MIKEVRLVRCSFVEFCTKKGDTALIKLNYPGEDRIVKVHCGTHTNRRHMARQIQWAVISDRPFFSDKKGNISAIKWMSKKGKWPYNNRVIVMLRLSQPDFALDWSKLKKKFLSPSPSFANSVPIPVQNRYYNLYQDWMWLPDELFGVRGCLTEDGLICHNKTDAILAFLSHSDGREYEYE